MAGLVALLEPLIVGFLGLVVGGIVIAMYLRCSISSASWRADAPFRAGLLLVWAVAKNYNLALQAFRQFLPREHDSGSIGRAAG